MEVVALSGNSNNAPFKREVHEWQHIDAKTGALLSGRAEANRYVNGNMNTYGKSLLQSFETSDGTKHKQHKQMDILQTITSTGGALQVVRAQIQTSHSSSRRAITSSTYSHYTNGTSTAAVASDVNSSMSSDLLSISPRPLQQHSPTSSRMKALLSSSSYFSSSPTTATNDGNSSNNRKNDLFHHINNNNINNDLNNGVGSVEAEFSRQQQMNEMLYGSKESNSFLRGKSASIEDLANIDDDDDVKPYDWKRVSKIRRSLQFPKTSETSRGRVNFIRSSRPADLPENSVNVWKIRQDIENSENMRRLSNASKTSTSSINSNQHSNGFVALDTILKTEPSPMDSLNSNHSKEESKSDLTAESLQEIRKRLKKLNVMDDESSPSPKFNDEFLLTEHENTNLSNQKLSLEQNCKSLELRKNKERDISAEDWLNRRKSYGFEKMYQPNESSSLGGIESSTDSGLGRSSDLPSNWSPTIDSPQRTIITFGDKTKPAATTSISLFSNPAHHNVKATDTGISDKPIPMRRKASLERKEEIKRHSIAIDEKVDEHYQHRNSSDRKISLINLNGPYNDKLSSTALVNDGRHKKVEFCKTEIHFAAESGRVNIVETDGKPPPTNNFRRRRRNSGALLDPEYSIQQESITIDDDEVDKPTIESHFDSIHKSNVTTTVGSIYSSTREDDTDEGHSDTDGLRGILKNKPIKPKPYHLGENLESGSSLWGVRLRPVENQHTTWRHSAELESVVTGKKSTEDALEIEFKNLVKAMDQEKSSNNTNSQHHYQSATVSSNGYSTKINLSSLPTIQQQHPANKDSSSSSTSSTATTTHKPTTFTSYNDSRQTSGNVLPDKDQRQKGGHKISIDLKLPHPSSMDTIMDELKSTSLIIKTMKSTSYFDDAMKHFEQESPLIRTSSLRLNNESLSKSNSTSMMCRNKSNAPVRYTSSLDGDHGILDGPDKRDDDFDFLNGFLEENRKFQMSIAQKEKENHNFSQSSSTSTAKSTPAPVAAPRLKKIMNPSQQLSQQLSQLKHLYDIANDSDENAMADEEVKSFLSKNEEEKSISELSGSWSRVRVKKIASAFQSASSSSSATTATTGDGTKWAKTPLTSLYENSTSSSSSSAATTKPVTIEAAPRTSLIQIGSIHEKVNNNSNIYSNVNTIQQDNSVKVNIQNFESLSPALSRSNSLRIKRDNVTNINSTGTKDDSSTLKLSTGTRQLKAHELTYFGVKGTPITRKTSDTNITNKSQYTHLSTTSTNVLSSSNKLNISNNSNNPSDKRKGVTNNVSATSSSSSSKVTINHQKPDLIMHHHQKIEKSSTPELTTSEKKSMLETLDSCIDETKNLEPIYENLYQNNKYERKLDLARDKKILDELARAADEIMNTCKEMYHADSEEKRRKSLLVTSNGTCLETIKEGTEGRQQQQQHSYSDVEQPKVMKSKGVQVSRNFEDSLRRYHRMQQRTSSQSSIESLPRNSKISTTSPSVTTRTRRTTKSGESTASTTISSTKSSSSCRKRENGTGSDGSKRIQRVSSRERMHKSNASSSESDHPNSSVEVPRRPRRTKVVKSHREEAVKDEKKSSRVTETSSSSRRSTKPEHNSTSKETKVRSSVLNKSSSSANPNSSILSTTAGGITTSSSRSKSRR